MGTYYRKLTNNLIKFKNLIKIIKDSKSFNY